jgi:hypothetical protein
MLLILLGAFMVIAGLLLMALKALDFGRLSGIRRGEPSPPQQTLEPRVRDTRFLSLLANWPGLTLMIVGALLLLLAPVI